MPDKKKKNTKESSEMEPRIVEVYGDNEELDPQLEINNQNDVQNTQANEAEKERETLTVEVVGEDKAEEAEQQLEKDVGNQASTATQTIVEKQNESSLRQTQDENAFDDEIGSQKKAVRSVFGVGLIIFLVVFGLTGWAFYLKSVWLPKESISQVIVADASPTPLPTATPPIISALGRDKITLEILNGSGVVGLAGKVATTFKELGYTSVDTGNSNAVTSTEVYIQKDLEPQLTIFMKDLADTLKVASVTGYLKNTDAMTVRVILSK